MQGGSDVPRAQERRTRRDGPNGLVKLAVITFLVVFTVMAVERVEAWPFTAWRLFSEPRTSVTIAPRAYAVSSSGVERPIALGELPVAYRQVNRLLVRFGRYTETERRSLCAGLAEGERNAGHDVASIRIYRVTSRSHIEHGEPVTRSTRRLLYSCPDISRST